MFASPFESRSVTPAPLSPGQNPCTSIVPGDMYRIMILIQIRTTPTLMCLPYLLDKPLAESRRDPLSGMDSTVQEDSRLSGAGLLTDLRLLKEEGQANFMTFTVASVFCFD